MEYKTQSVGGESIKYFISGRGHALLFLHAFGIAPERYDVLLEQLSQRFEVVAPKMYGLGYLRVQPVNLRQYTELTHDFLTVLGIDHPYIVGHSVGGGVAIELGNGSEYPEKIVGVNTLLQTGLSVDDFCRLIITLRSKRGEVNPDFIEKARERYGRAFQFLEDIAGFSYEGMHVNQPTLMLYAGDDEVFQLDEDTRKELEGAFDDLDNLVIRVVEDRKHFWPISHPKEIRDHVFGFVSD